MDIHQSFGDDYLTWDNTVPVIIEFATNPNAPPSDPVAGDGNADASQRIYVPVVKRKSITVEEKFPTGGTYTAGRTSWLVPAALLPPRTTLKPGDTLIEMRGRTAGTRHTTLTATPARGGTTWKLDTVDLEIAFDLKNVISIERAAITYSGSGVAVKAFPTGPGARGGKVLYGALACNIQPVTQDLAERLGIHGFEGDYSITVAREIAVVAEDRVAQVQGNQTLYYDILGYKASSRIDELPQLTVTRLP